jgi:hypothetical protein
MIDRIKIRFAQIAALAIAIIAISATRTQASTLTARDRAHAQVFNINLENANRYHGAVQFDAHKIFDVAIDVTGAVDSWSNSTSVVQSTSIGILLPAYYLDLLEFLDLSPFDAGGSIDISRATAAVRSAWRPSTAPL